MKARSLILLAVCLAWWQPAPAGAQPPLPPKREYLLKGVKSGTKFSTGIRNYYGVVDAIGADSITLTCTCAGNDEPQSRTFDAIDVLAKGGLQDWAEGADAYLWSDVKKGDRIRLGVVRDEVEDKQYAVEVCIERRPKGTIPESQRPKGDERRLRQVNVLNDIDNGLDVDEGVIAKAFPAKRDPVTQNLRELGGVPPNYQDKLDAIRAKKKDKDLKAPPPEKK